MVYVAGGITGPATDPVAETERATRREKRGARRTIDAARPTAVQTELEAL